MFVTMQLEEEEDVYEEMDEDTYAAHVESRRNQEDFVVDDNGNGYADNGEEWIGATEDEKERKKRAMKRQVLMGIKNLPRMRVNLQRLVQSNRVKCATSLVPVSPRPTKRQLRLLL